MDDNQGETPAMAGLLDERVGPEHDDTVPPATAAKTSARFAAPRSLSSTRLDVSSAPVPDAQAPERGSGAPCRRRSEHAQDPSRREVPDALTVLLGEQLRWGP